MADVTTDYVAGPGGFYKKDDRSGPYTIDSNGDAQLITGADDLVGALDDAAWDGSGNPTSIIALLKGVYAKLVEIETNTTPV